jgi:hypothetical protein
VGPVPQVLRAVSPVLMEQVIDGFPSCFLHFQRGELKRDGKTYGFTPHVLILICAQRPPHPASITVDAIAARWMPGGLAVLVPTGGSGAAYLSSRVWPALVAQARAQGAVPILPVHEVADPTPLDPAQHARELAVQADAMADARLESRCGAPTAARPRASRSSWAMRAVLTARRRRACRTSSCWSCRRTKRGCTRRSSGRGRAWPAGS